MNKEIVVSFAWGCCQAVDYCEHSNRYIIKLRTWSSIGLLWTQ